MSSYFLAEKKEKPRRILTDGDDDWDEPIDDWDENNDDEEAAKAGLAAIWSIINR